MPATVIDDLETWDADALGNWIDYVEEHVLHIRVATQYRQNPSKNNQEFPLNEHQAEVLKQLLSLSLAHQRAVVGIAKVFCRSMKQTSV